MEDNLWEHVDYRKIFNFKASQEVCEADSAIGSDHHVSFDESTIKGTPNNSEKKLRLTFHAGIHLFNRNPKKGIEYFIQNQIVEGNSLKIAEFILKYGNLLSSAKTGEYFEDYSIQTTEVLNCLVKKMKFTDTKIEEAVGILLKYIEVKDCDSELANRVIPIFCDYYLRSNMVYHSNIINLVKTIIGDNYNTQASQYTKNPKTITCDDRKIDGMSCKVNSGTKYPLVPPERDHEVNSFTILRKIAPNLIEAHRRFVSYCRLNTVEKPSQKVPKSRGIFLFNDTLIVVKIAESAIRGTSMKNKVNIHLFGLHVVPLSNTLANPGVQLVRDFDKSVVLKFFTEFSQDLSSFINDIKHCISETNLVESICIQNNFIS